MKIKQLNCRIKVTKLILKKLELSYSMSIRPRDVTQKFVWVTNGLKFGRFGMEHTCAKDILLMIKNKNESKRP